MRNTLIIIIIIMMRTWRSHGTTRPIFRMTIFIICYSLNFLSSIMMCSIYP